MSPRPELPEDGLASNSVILALAVVFSLSTRGCLRPLHPTWLSGISLFTVVASACGAVKSPAIFPSAWLVSSSRIRLLFTSTGCRRSCDTAAISCIGVRSGWVTSDSSMSPPWVLNTALSQDSFSSVPVQWSSFASCAVWACVKGRSSYLNTSIITTSSIPKLPGAACWQPSSDICRTFSLRAVCRPPAGIPCSAVFGMGYISAAPSSCQSNAGRLLSFVWSFGMFSVMSWRCSVVVLPVICSRCVSPSCSISISSKTGRWYLFMLPLERSVIRPHKLVMDLDRLPIVF
ncbi:hypothetical protein FB567DRAFT_515230 [Paraphoma chrysanthemicola]|uniref:Uncharacterized protein n=1 Tax=Paraphoma chrysanthemicola TaxID=798071 RepID=A0A8K0W450_9PLEO|nr:hypothetical protein FB567DRAFT_515230 [Paraphoma chrysanthemicola]